MWLKVKRAFGARDPLCDVTCVTSPTLLLHFGFLAFVCKLRKMPPKKQQQASGSKVAVDKVSHRQTLAK
jgi:hypothetical protein